MKMRYLINLVVILMSAYCCVALCETHGKIYYGIYHNDAWYMSKPSFSKGKALSQSEVLNQLTYYTEETLDDGSINVVGYRLGEESSYLFISPEGYILKSRTSDRECTYKPADEKTHFECVSLDGGFLYAGVEYFISGQVVKVEYVNSEDEISKYILFDRIRKKLYTFSSEDEFLGIEDM